MNVTMDRVIVGVPMYALDGDEVSYTAPAGCALRKSVDFVTWRDVSEPSPFVHSGHPTHYRIDCDTYEGTPKIATLTITGGGA